jgi:hypothetical protein
MDLNTPGDLYPEVTNRIEKISEELSQLRLLVENYDKEPIEFGTLDKLRLIGVRPSALKMFDDLSNETEIGSCRSKISKSLCKWKMQSF